MPVHDKNRRDQIGAELRLLKHCREDAKARERKSCRGGDTAGYPEGKTIFAWQGKDWCSVA